MSSSISNTEYSNLKTHIEDLECDSDSEGQIRDIINKSHFVKDTSLIWCARPKVPWHIPPHHVKLLNQLYIKVQKKRWTVPNL